MSENNQVARPYAQAAFEHAAEHDALATWSTALEKLSIAVTDEAMVRVLNDPTCDQATIIKILQKICATDNQHVSNFITILAKNKRFSVVPDIFNLFSDLKIEHEQAIEAQVTSAFTLSEQQKDALQAALARKFDGRKILLQCQNDPQLIGGIKVCVGDQVIDNSILGKIQRLKAHLNLKGTL